MSLLKGRISILIDDLLVDESCPTAAVSAALQAVFDGIRMVNRLVRCA